MNTGIIRHIDELGRITLPIELRRSLGINERDLIQVYVDDEKIILKKFFEGDIFDGSTDELVEFEGKKVSKKSIKALAELAGLTVTE